MSTPNDETLANTADRPPRVLITVVSSGESPFLDIEREAQLETWAINTHSNVRTIWIEGDPSLAKRPRFKALNWVMGLVLRNIYGPTFHLSLQGGRMRLRVNVKSFLDKFYDASAAKNRFSRALQTLMGEPEGSTPLADGRRVRLGVPNSYSLHQVRAIERYRYLGNIEFDYVLQTTSTCYVDIPALTEFVSRLPSNGVYAGPKMKFGCEFVPGNNILMSRDVFQRVLELRKNIRLDLPDDVGLGQLISDFKLASIMDMPTENVSTGLRSIDDLGESWRSAYVFRCKAETRTLNSSPVIELMHRLHKLVTAQSTQH